MALVGGQTPNSGRQLLFKGNHQMTDKQVNPRPVYFVCAAINKAGALASEKLQFRERDEAVKAFKLAHKVEPTMIEGPWYEVKGTSPSETVRLSVSVPASEIAYTAKRYSGVYQGWKVIAFGLSTPKSKPEIKDNELVFLNWDGPVSKDAKTPKPRFGGAAPIVRRDQLENVAESK